MKQLLKKIILSLSYISSRNNNSKIIYYHDVSKKYTDMGTDLDDIKNHFEIVRNCRYDIVREISKPQNQVMVCFDDGWAGLYDSKDFFFERGVFPTIFIAVDLIGKPGYLTLKQILELQERGFVFEGHSWSHHDLTQYDDETLVHEIRDSKEELSRLLGKTVEAICFPQGRFSDKVYHCCVDAGYSKMYSSITGGYYDLLESRNLICRNLVQSASKTEFRLILNSTSHYFVKRNIKLHYQH